MKFTRVKAITSLIASASLLGISLAAKADNLNISNSLDNNLSFRINDNCSAEFGDIKPRTVKVISEADFNNACIASPQSCLTQVFNSANCKGEVIASIVFDTKSGVNDIRVYAPIRVLGNGFNLFFQNNLIKKLGDN